MSEKQEFSGRRALVTGGSRGIGAAIAQRLLDGGATVVVTARARNEATPPKATFIEGDVRTNAGAKKIAVEAIGVLGVLDILVNAAGATRVFLQGSASIPDEEWLDSLAINFLSAVRVTNAVLPALKASKTAAVINISSGGTSAPGAPLLHYLTAKAALNLYSSGLANELASNKIRVNVVTPGSVITPGGDEVRKVFTDALNVPAEQLSKVPLGRFGQPRDIAEMVAFLASDRAEWITGQNYFVNGGAS